VAIDPKHLPEDPKMLQQMVLDLMAQLDREFTERNKIESLLRELLDAKRNRKSEQLSADQLALFAELLQARQAPAESPAKRNDSDDDAAGGATSDATPKGKTRGRQPLPKNLLRERIVHDLAEAEKHCQGCGKDLLRIPGEVNKRSDDVNNGSGRM
jgi:DNA primase